MPITSTTSASSSHQATASLGDIKSRITKVATSNFGAARVLLDLFQQKGLKQFETTVGKLESQQVYGHLVWMRYKDDCGENLEKFIKATDDASASAGKHEKTKSSVDGRLSDNYAVEDHKPKANGPSAPGASDALQKPSR